MKPIESFEIETPSAAQALHRESSLGPDMDAEASLYDMHERSLGGEGACSRCWRRALSPQLWAMLLAPLLVFGGVLAVALNEWTTICEDRDFLDSKAAVQEVPCDGSSEKFEGQLVFAACEVPGARPVAELHPPLARRFAEDEVWQAFLTRPALGLRLEVAQLQCVEDVKEASAQDGVRTYEYFAAYRRDTVQPFENGDFRSSGSFRSQCRDQANVPFPEDLADLHGSVYVPKLSVGPLQVAEAGLRKLSLDWKVHLALSQGESSEVLPDGERDYGTSFYVRPAGRTAQDIGTVRLTPFIDRPTNRKMSVLGRNEGGTVGPYTFAAKWPCQGEIVEEYFHGAVSIDRALVHLSRAKMDKTWFWRVVGLGLLWGGIFRFCWRTRGLVSCLVFFRSWFDDPAESSVYVIGTCPQACSLCWFVTGAFWIAMRPAVGATLWILVAVTGIASLIFKARMRTIRLPGTGGGSRG